MGLKAEANDFVILDVYQCSGKKGITQKHIV